MILTLWGLYTKKLLLLMKAHSRNHHHIPWIFRFVNLKNYSNNFWHLVFCLFWFFFLSALITVILLISFTYSTHPPTQLLESSFKVFKTKLYLFTFTTENIKHSWCVNHHLPITQLQILPMHQRLFKIIINGYPLHGSKQTPDI